MPAIFLVLILTLVFLIVFGLFFINAIALSFLKLGLTLPQTFLAFLGILLGSYINIPISHRWIKIDDSHRRPNPFFYYPPKCAEQVIYVNMGGAVIPVLLSLYFIPHAPLVPTLIAILGVTTVSKLLARIVPGVGITMPAFIPPIVSAMLALGLAPGNTAAVAYISGVLGTLIGADLLNLGKLKAFGPTSVSIGGAGIFDGVFLVGIFAALLA